MEQTWEQITAPFQELPEASRQRWGACCEQVATPPLMIDLSTGHLTLDSFNPRELAEKAAQDAVLGARLLAVANSAKFGLTTPLTSIQRAVVHLGFNLVKSITMAYLLETSFQELAPAAKSHIQHLRSLSAGAAVLAHKWAQQAELPDPSTVATVTLLSQVGGLVLSLDKNPPDENYRVIMPGLELLRYEWENWEITTVTLGTEQAKRWGLPEPIYGAISRLWQPLVHKLTLGDEQRLLCIAAVSVELVRRFKFDAELKPGAMIDAAENQLLKENLIKLKLLDSLIDLWGNARLQRELSGALQAG